jgi:hypothetical protein
MDEKRGFTRRTGSDRRVAERRSVTASRVPTVSGEKRELRSGLRRLEHRRGLLNRRMHA